jgi:hypothetical protein
MSSHREAPESSKDPVADNTDVYAFVSPDKPDTVTLIANFIPFQIPQGGPNFAEFGDDVLYTINVSNGGQALADVRFDFRFTTHVRTPSTFLYNTGPIKKITDKTWNRYQTYSCTMTTRATNKSRILGKGLKTPPVNVGVRSTPNYADLAKQAIFTNSASGVSIFAGQRAEGFFVDLGSIFDLGALRPFTAAHLIPLNDGMKGINGTQDLNVHTIAIQVPKSLLTASGSGTPDASTSDAVIGVWATASRQAARVFNTSKGTYDNSGPFVQVSRLAMPLINEVINPVSQKDVWNTTAPHNDSAYVANYATPQLQGLLPVLYPGVFPNLKAYNKPRADLEAILLTGIPSGIVSGFQNYTGSTQADMIRLNLAVPPATNPNPIGLLAGDAAGFPNGRRVFDNVVAIELRAIAGLTIPLVDSSYTPDAAASLLTDGTSNTNSKYLSSFPYLGTPAGGYESLPGNPKTS